MLGCQKAAHPAIFLPVILFSIDIDFEEISITELLPPDEDLSAFVKAPPSTLTNCIPRPFEIVRFSLAVSFCFSISFLCCQDVAFHDAGTNAPNLDIR